MADTHRLKTHIEPFVRKWLEKNIPNSSAESIFRLFHADASDEIDCGKPGRVRTPNAE